jgi:hypothetical protein
MEVLRKREQTLSDLPDDPPAGPRRSGLEHPTRVGIAYRIARKVGPPRRAKRQLLPVVVDLRLPVND